MEDEVLRGGVADAGAAVRSGSEVLCVPIDDEANASRLGWEDVDRASRLRVVADVYGLGEDERAALLPLIDGAMGRVGEFVRRRVELGEPGFGQMWAEMGGQACFDRRRRWWAEHRRQFENQLSGSRGSGA